MNEKTDTRRNKPPQSKKPNKRIIPVVSAITDNGGLLETVFDPIKNQPQLIHWDGNKKSILDSYSPDNQTRMVPSASIAPLVEHSVLRLPSDAIEYGETSDLLDAIRAYIHRYVDVSEAFERLAANYVLLTWVYDRFRELPYLRRRGDYGTGKTRFLSVIGSICYKPIFAGGASTASPLFHLVNQIQGTLIIDEADFRFSDESALIAKILNSGNVDGYPILRSEAVNNKEFKPRAFRIFGPKIVGMRKRYDDPALESRFLTETSSNPTLRSNIPINLPSEQDGEAQVLRNKLLMYRFLNYRHMGAPKRIEGFDIEPRMHQILAPLLSVSVDETDRQAILAHATLAQDALDEARGQSLEAEVLVVIKKLMGEEKGAGVSIREISECHGRAFLKGVCKPISPRSMGHIVRTRLNLRTQKSHGVFIIPKAQDRSLIRLYKRYGVSDEDIAQLTDTLGETTRLEFGDVGDDPASGKPKPD